MARHRVDMRARTSIPRLEICATALPCAAQQIYSFCTDQATRDALASVQLERISERTRYQKKRSALGECTFRCHTLITNPTGVCSIIRQPTSLQLLLLQHRLDASCA
eukprot:4244293-Amphidinium_carterae.1